MLYETSFQPNFQKIFETLPELYLILLPDFKICAVSDSYLKATMTERDKVVGRGIFEIFPDNPKDLTANGVSNLRASLQRVVETKAPDTMAVQRYDVRLPESEGGEFTTKYWSPLNVPTLDDQGNLLYIVHRVTDVSEFMRMHQLGEEQEKINKDLQLRASKMEVELYRRSQELQNANNGLRKANESVELANKELESFSYSVAHDLRTPLRGIIGFSTLLLRQTKSILNEDALDNLQRVVKAAQTMGLLVEGLLGLASLSRKELVRRPVNLTQLAEEIARELRTAQPQRDVNFRIHPDLLASGDLSLLRAALTNLLGNAWKYTARKNGTAEIEFGKGERDGRAFYFIRDNGAGFEMQYVDKLFKNFQRLHSEQEFEGIGVGLATVQRIVQRHGGQIWAEGKPLEGATFFFTLSN